MKNVKKIAKVAEIAGLVILGGVLAVRSGLYVKRIIVERGEGITVMLPEIKKCDRFTGEKANLAWQVFSYRNLKARCPE